MTQEAKGAALVAEQPGPETAPVEPQPGNPPSQPEQVVFASQEEYEKALNAGRSDLGRELKAAKDRIVEQDTEMAVIRTSQEGIRKTQRVGILAGIDDPATKAAQQADFDREDRDAAATQRSNDLDARERQITVNASANTDIAAQAKAVELVAGTTILPQALLDSPLVKDRLVDGTEVFNLSKMEALAGTLKGNPPGEQKGLTAIGSNTPAAIAAAANDAEFKRAWGEGELPNTKPNQDRARTLTAGLGV